jgi:hypothetical protein
MVIVFGKLQIGNPGSHGCVYDPSSCPTPLTTVAVVDAERVTRPGDDPLRSSWVDGSGVGLSQAWSAGRGTPHSRPVSAPFGGWNTTTSPTEGALSE